MGVDAPTCGRGLASDSPVQTPSNANDQIEKMRSRPARVGMFRHYNSRAPEGRRLAAPPAVVMGKSRRRKDKKNGVDTTMAVAAPAGDAGWVVGDGVTAMLEGEDGAAAVAPTTPTVNANGGKMTAGIRVGKKTPTVLRGITKRKKKMIAKGIAHAERKEGNLKKKTFKRGLRQEAKGYWGGANQ